jgi:nitrous oxidase accessory protein NosD
MTRTRTLLMTALLCGLATAAGAVVRVVDDDLVQCPSATYRRIGDALAAASDGDVIQVCAGTYPEQLVLTKRVQLTGVAPAFGSSPVLAPTALPALADSLGSGKPVAAGILVDHVRTVIDGFVVDLGANTLTSCSPVLVGIYLRDAEAVVRNVTVQNARLATQPTCDSGVGLLAESDGAAPFPRGRMRVLTRDNTFVGYQRAGMVATGPGLTLKERGSSATGRGLDPDAVQIGFQLSNQASGILKEVTATGNATSIPGRTASGVLLANATSPTVRRATLTSGQTGIFAIGDQVRLKGNGIRDMSDDGIVLLGSHSTLFGNTITNAAVPGITGMFIAGGADLVRGGRIEGVPPVSVPIGIWFFGPLAPSDSEFAVSFTNVVTQVQGVAGGPRDLGESAAAAFTLACASDADCNDGALCTTSTCTVSTGTCTHTAGCDDGNVCTTDSCDPVQGCVHTLVSCDDANPCTADLCNPVTGCYHQNLADGTPCGTNLTCTAGVCG